MNPKKTCPKCGRAKTIGEFGKDRHKKSGHNCYCKICCRKAQQLWSKNNRDKLLIYSEKYRKTLKGYIVKVVADIKQRCFNKNNPRYGDYSGIKLYFTSGELCQWCLDNHVDPRSTNIHRMDSDGDYTLDNIEFLTKSEHTILHNLEG